MDFTLKTYKKLLDSLLNQGFSFQTFCEYIEKPFDKTIVLRHDVDKLPENCNDCEFEVKNNEEMGFKDKKLR